MDVDSSYSGVLPGASREFPGRRKNSTGQHPVRLQYDDHSDLSEWNCYYHGRTIETLAWALACRAATHPFPVAPGLPWRSAPRHAADCSRVAATNALAASASRSISLQFAWVVWFMISVRFQLNAGGVTTRSLPAPPCSLKASGTMGCVPTCSE